jgi:ADP-heptose:LPS heptosyltransferase
MPDGSRGTVLLRRSALGDVVLLGSVTAALPRPVTVVTAPEWMPVAARLRGVDAVVPWPKDRAPELPRGRRVDLQGTLKSWWIHADHRIDKRGVQRRMRMWFGVGGPRPPVPMLYGEACGVEPVGGPWIDVEGTRELLAVAPGAAWATKRWRVDGFRAVVAAWDGPVVVVGGPGEEALCAAVAAGRPGVEVVCERGFDRTIDALGRAKVALAGDTGLMHLAGACGAAVVAVFGSTHPEDGFWVYDGEVVERGLACRPCTLHGRNDCPIGTFACMDIAPDVVLAACKRVWAACAG